MVFVRKRNTELTDEEIWEKMTTQAELFKSLKNRGSSASDDAPRPPFIKFENVEDIIQGEVIDTFVGTVYDPVNKTSQKDKNGDEIPQLVVTLKIHAGSNGRVKVDGRVRDVAEGETVRQGFSGDLLWKLGTALEELGLDSLPKGAAIASRWDGMFMKNGVETRAREHTVKVAK